MFVQHTTVRMICQISCSGKKYGNKQKHTLNEKSLRELCMYEFAEGYVILVQFVDYQSRTKFWLKPCSLWRHDVA